MIPKDPLNLLQDEIDSLLREYKAPADFKARLHHVLRQHTFLVKQSFWITERELSAGGEKIVDYKRDIVYRMMADRIKEYSTLIEGPHNDGRLYEVQVYFLGKP